MAARDAGGGAVVEIQDQDRPALGGRRSYDARTLGRLAAAAGLGAVLVTGILFSVELLPDDETGLGRAAVRAFWLIAAVLVFALVLPAWLGSAWGRRVLGVASFAGFAGALHWLSYEPGDAQGYAAGITVALLLATATVATLLAERRRQA